MAIKIGHASYGEDGIRNQIAGDASGKEVLIATWFDKKWVYVLRPKSAALAEKSAKAMEDACANNNIGYDQYGRNTLYAQAKANAFNLAKIKVKCECDCSSLVHVCAIAGGANLPYGSNGLTTHTMKQAFTDSGDYEVLTDKKYLTSDKYLKRGDILVKPGSHTIMILENGSGIATNKKKEDKTYKMNTLRKGSTGNDVTIFESIMKKMGYYTGKIDNSFGNLCVSACNKFQTDYPECGSNGKPDGSFGTKSWTKALSLLKG